MQRSFTIIFRKIVASLLLGLLVFVYAEKSFHIHEKVSSSTEQTAISIIANNTGCSICDFTVAKDAELPGTSGINVPFTFLVKAYTPTSITYHFQTDNSTNDRGPPSF